MKLNDILQTQCDSCVYEELLFDPETKEIIEEGAIKAFQRRNKKIVRRYRCLTGPKQGKLVSDPAACSQRKDPKKVRRGRQIAKKTKGIRVMKTRVAKRSQASKMVTKMNRRLAGK